MGLLDRLNLQQLDPRKPETGVSRQSEGTLTPKKRDFIEKGSQAVGTIRDVVPGLGSWHQAIGEYQKMTLDDAAVDVSLRAAKVPVQGGTYFIEPFDEKEENLDISEFVDFNIFHGMSTPFLLTMEEILRFYDYGFSILEKVFETREWAPNREGAHHKKYTMLRKLAPRPAGTIKKFLYDENGGPTGVQQMAIRPDGKPEEVNIDIRNLMVFSFNKEGGNLHGKSILRTSYKHWKYKDGLYKVDAIQKERHALGVPHVKLPPNFNENDRKLAHEMARNIRTNEQAHIVTPPGWDVEFAKFEGQLVDVMKSIDHHNGMIMLNTMVQFLLLGLQQAGGGRATAGSHQNMYEKALKYVANLVCEFFNLYCIPQLVTYNWKTDEFPRMKVRNIGEAKDLQMWASGMANLFSQNAITADLETEQWVREQADMPAKKGDKQTPEANAGSASLFNKGGVQTGGETDNSGNVPQADDEG